MKDRPLDTDGDMAEPPRRTRIGKQVVRQQCVEIEDGTAIEADPLCPVDQKLDRVFVVKPKFQRANSRLIRLPVLSYWVFRRSQSAKCSH